VESDTGVALHFTIRDVGQFHIVTSPRMLAGMLWAYGEDALWERALQLPAETVADIGERAGVLALDAALADRISPDRPRAISWVLVVATIEALEGRARPPARRRRRPDRAKPEGLTDILGSRDPEWQRVNEIVQHRVSPPATGGQAALPVRRRSLRGRRR
jgi:hypothetical protein